VKLHDNGGTANGGVDTSAPQTFNINVLLINDAPSFTKGPDQNVPQDGPQTLPGWATNVSPDGNPVPAANEAGQALNFLVSTSNAALFAVQPKINAAGDLSYTPARDATGTALVTVQLHDNGGTANGGVDTSAPQTFNITVFYANDAPSFTRGPDQNVLENAGPQTVPGWATNVSPDDTPVPAANEAGQAVNFIVSNNNNALFTVQPSIDATGKLTYTPVAETSGSAVVTVQLHDNGGTANGGVDTSAALTFNINVLFVNQAPSFTKGADHTVLENAGAQTITGWAGGISPDQNFPPKPDEAGQSLNFIVSSNNNALFAVQPSIDLITGNLTYTPAPDSSGTALVTVQLHDNGGTANGGVDTTTQTFHINVLLINDAPTFTAGPDQTVLEDAGAQTVTGWATTVSPDQYPTPAANEAGQLLNFIVTNSNNALFAIQPAIDPATGTLTYTPAPDTNGSAVVTVRLHDNGGTANGGVDTSPAQTFNLNVLYVNDAPSFIKGPDQTVFENTPAQTVPGWATAISPDEHATPSPNEAGQTVTITVTNDDPGLFAVQPAISAAGTLTYTPAANVTGTATVTVQLHDNGGTANGGSDTSVQTFLIGVKIATATTLTAPASSTYGQTVTFTAQVTPVSGSAAPLAGENVAFEDGSAVLATVALDGTGAASYSTTALLAGTHSITAVYAGDANYAASSSAPPQTLTIARAATTTTVHSSQPVTPLGQPVTFTAQVTPASGSASALAGETVTFTEGATNLGSGTLDATGSASFTTSALGLGMHTVTAVYNGDAAKFVGSTGNVAQQVKKAVVAILTSSVNPSIQGQAVTFRARVTPSSGSARVLAGETVQFIDQFMGSTTVLATRHLNRSGVAGFTTSVLALGSHSITVVYPGDAAFASSTSAAVTQTVVTRSKMALHASANPSGAGLPVTFTATVTGSGGIPTGTVSFYLDGVLQAAVDLTDGAAAFTSGPLKAGTHTLRAIYSGDASFSRNSARLTELVTSKNGGRRQGV
jgi:hypothetical protein